MAGGVSSLERGSKMETPVKIDLPGAPAAPASR
jgi:hypothetical protein